MKKRNLLIIAGLMSALLLTGCQSNGENSETAALKQQIAQLEQQVASLEQQNTPEPTDDTAKADAQESAAPDTADASSGNAATTTRTMEELTAMVDSFAEKADAAAPSGTNSENLEQFFSLKQEEKQIDNELDIHENELEAEYRNGSLTHEEYKTLERELDKLEDKLDLAEDRLELTFGIDD